MMHKKTAFGNTYIAAGGKTEAMMRLSSRGVPAEA
jgi:hypothetical protein